MPVQRADLKPEPPVQRGSLIEMADGDDEMIDAAGYERRSY
jgi:hypothetical protein